MLKITKRVEWEMWHRIPNHKGKCRYPHGHHYCLDVTFLGKVCTQKGSSDEGMVCDFGDLKNFLKKTIYNHLDHRFLVYEKDRKFRNQFTPAIEKEFNFFVVDFIPTTENLLLWVVERIKSDLPKELRLTHARLYESKNHWAEYSDENER